MDAARIKLGNKIDFCKEMYDVAVDSDALALLTEWSEFRIPNYNILGKLLKNKL